MPDEELLSASREGDTAAFAELWERHRKPGLTAARSLAPSLDPEDLVSEAYLTILELVRDGRGPQGAFRPYLYRVIRSAAANRFRAGEHTDVELTDAPALHETAPWEDNAFDLNAVTEAFATLTPRWQSVLWYTEVEGMPPREAAKLLGISANSTSVLAGRARDALKSAWVEAHVNRQLADEACRSTIENLQRYQRKKLTARVTREVEIHLDECASCALAAVEAATLNRQLGLVLAWISLGAAGTAALAEQLNIAGYVGIAAGGAAVAAGAQGGGAAAGGGATAGSIPAAIASGVSGLVSSIGLPAAIGGASLLLVAAAGVGVAAISLPAEVPLAAPVASAGTDDGADGAPAAASPGTQAPSRTRERASDQSGEAATSGEVLPALDQAIATADGLPPALIPDSGEHVAVPQPLPLPATPAPREPDEPHTPTPVVDPPVTEPPTVEPPVIEPPIVKPPVIKPPIVEPPVIEPPIIEPPIVEPPIVEPPIIEPPVIEPPVIEPPVIEPPIVEPPIVEPPVIEPPVIEPPVIEPPIIEPPIIEPPVIKPPTVDPPTTWPPWVRPPITWSPKAST